MADMPDSFALWFDYDLHSNLRVLHVIENHVGHLPDDTLKLFSHVIASHHIWNSRINGQPKKYTVWERIPVSEMEAAIEKNHKDTLEILQRKVNETEITYTTTAGDRYLNSVADIFFHVLTHNHYHRGQIARNLREHNIDPPETNYITYRR